jgi:hypothetical protein
MAPCCAILRVTTPGRRGVLAVAPQLTKSMIVAEIDSACEAAGFMGFTIQSTRVLPMRNPFAKVIVASLAALTIWSAVAQAQGRGGQQPGFVAAGVPAMPNPPGPAPEHDLTGAWVGPIKFVMGPYSPMTPAGQAAFKLNKPIKRGGSDSATGVEPNNDPFAICDPLGFPRDLLNHWLSHRGTIWFEPVSNRIVMLFEQQRVFREVWMDARQLPAKVDAPGFPDSRFYGISVGHWDGNSVFVIDTMGLDARSWLDEDGLPHTNAAKLQERWTRVDQYNLEATVTVDDPQYFTKPFQLMKTDYYWKKTQDMEEELCLPSEALRYREKVSDPSGWGAGAKP